jgi:anaphase-promoting complex subunit 11
MRPCVRRLLSGYPNAQREREAERGSINTLSHQPRAPTRRGPLLSQTPSPPPFPAADPDFKVEILHWHGVASWTWGAGDDVCGICRAPYDGAPPEAKGPGDDAPVVWGACGHAFHIQCIQRWLVAQAEPRCPYCRRVWEFKAAEEVDGGGGGGGEQEGEGRSPPPGGPPARRARAEAVTVLVEEEEGVEEEEVEEEGMDAEW